MATNTQPGVGFVLPQGTRSNANNLASPLPTINQSIDPWGFLADPAYGVPTKQQQAKWNQLVCERYGQPRAGGILPQPGTSFHSTDFQSALQVIAQMDPTWFSTRGYGPGPSGYNGNPTQLEIHDAQYAQGICDLIIQHAANLQGAPGPGGS